MSIFAAFQKLVRDCLTENDGVSYCPVRVVGSSLTLPAIAIFLYAAFLKAHAGELPLMDFATALGVMIGGVTTLFSAAIAMKAYTDTPNPTH